MSGAIKIFFATAIALLLCYYIFRPTAVEFCVPETGYCVEVDSQEEYRLFEAAYYYTADKGRHPDELRCSVATMTCNVYFNIESNIMTVLLECNPKCKELVAACLGCKTLDWTLLR